MAVGSNSNSWGSDSLMAVILGTFNIDANICNFSKHKLSYIPITTVTPYQVEIRKNNMSGHYSCNCPKRHARLLQRPWVTAEGSVGTVFSYLPDAWKMHLQH